MEGYQVLHRCLGLVHRTESYFKTTQIYCMKNLGPIRDVSYLALILFQEWVTLFVFPSASVMNLLFCYYLIYLSGVKYPLFHEVLSYGAL